MTFILIKTKKELLLKEANSQHYKKLQSYYIENVILKWGEDEMKRSAIFV